MLRRSLGTFLLSLVIGGCASRVVPDNNLVAELSREDQAAQMDKPVPRSDQDRINLILHEIALGRINTPEDKVNAALILDHSPMTFRDNKLMAKSPDNYLLAHYLAKSAFDSGYRKAALLVAQTIDRYLSMTTGCQKYGTNRFINQSNGAEELAPIDRKTTDEERSRLGVPPLAKLLSQYPEQKVLCRTG